MKKSIKIGTIIVFITTIIDIIVMIKTFQTKEITWYLIALSVINFWFFLPFILSKNLIYLIISIISCYFIFDSFWLAIMIGLIWWIIIFDIETLIDYKKVYNLLKNVEDTENEKDKL